LAKVLWEDVAFDFMKGTNTFSPVSKQSLFSDELAEKQNRYVPSTFGLVESSLAHLDKLNKPLHGSFVDYGSGKGKVLIAAARRAFPLLKGIEYAKELHEIAERNMQKLDLQDRVELIQGDASTYLLDEDDRILYFFNPFLGDILDRCLSGIAASSQQQERILIYANPVEDETFCKYFTKIDSQTFQPGSVHVNFYSTLPQNATRVSV